MSSNEDAVDAATRAARALVGHTIAEKFSLERLLGMGGMGAVYAATNTWTGRRVAVKMLLQSVSSPDAVASESVLTNLSDFAITHEAISLDELRKQVATSSTRTMEPHPATSPEVSHEPKDTGMQTTGSQLRSRLS